jgi:deoxyribonuclease-4
MRAELDQGPYAVHVTYLVNLAASSLEVRKRSLSALQAEMDAAAAYGAEYVVLHPGAATGAASREVGMQAIVSGIDALSIPRDTMLLLETMSGKGTTIGTTAEELGALIDAAAAAPGTLGVCLDTCHAYCAGYPLHTADGLSEMLDSFEDAVGLEAVRLVHCNDSKHPFLSGRDEHAHIGWGHIGADAFRRIVNEPRLRRRPFVLETPVEDRYGHAEDISFVRSLYDD